uniref:ADAM metallopeptidase with thrombospondin type 1 motif 7 n=1 Tax=Anas platyrhynchos TaxID=8839 RepID=A0A8B9T6I7_ANAPL
WVSDIVHPIKVDETGAFLSYDLSHRVLHRRSLSSKSKFLTFYEMHYKGQPLKFNLSLNNNLLAPGFVSERRYGGIADAKIQSHTYNSCHMIGEVQSRTLKGESRENLERSEKRRERWEQKQHRKRRIKQRSISKEKWVETLVVADTKMIEYHGSENIEKYVLTVMNMVAGLFHHASIGNPINIAIVRLILLETEEEDLKISHHADNTLKSFCKWQKSINVKGDSHPLHHDVAVLLTRKDICAAMNRPCETLGLSHVAGMCQPHRSCNINEDTGLPLAFTVAHELGHSFGIQHDGSSNDCEPVGKRPFIMSPQLLYDTSPLTWSRCSREYITRFLDRGWGLCLDDPPAREVLDFPLVPPGVLYDVGHQCRLQYGAYSTFCDDMDSVCNTLWCTVGTTCHSKLDAWCFNGECVPVGYRPDAIDGSWGPWSSWAACSRSCGAGVQSAERQCSSPTPKYGGRYCLGERKRFRICNIRPCPPDKPSFRQVQCSQFNPMPYKGKLYKWTPVPNNINPCELHCRPENEYFAEKLRDAVIDGTPCYEMNASRDMCINGICKNVGCDYEIDSNAVEDRCGVCHGDGSTCHTVQKMFEDSEGLGYVDIGIIPAGAREIRIEEVAEAGNFLALRSEDPEKYFLNGGWTIQWNGDYRVAGTTFTYARTGNWENLTSPGPTVEPCVDPGTGWNEIEQTEFLWRFGSWTTCTCHLRHRQIVHCVEKLAGIVEERYCDALTRPDDQQRTCNEEPCPARSALCSFATCGTSGLMKRTVLCIQSVGLDEQRALQQADCQHLSKPESTAPCQRDVPCPSQWAVGNWSECSATCGNGTQRRPVYCSNNTQATCDPEQRPSSETICSLPQCQMKLGRRQHRLVRQRLFQQRNPRLPLGALGAAFSLQCSATCGVGAIWRSVRCSTGTERRCSLRPCSSWRVGNWSKCSRNCGGGVKVRDVHCIDTRDQRLLRPFHCQAVLYKPPAQMPCQSTPCLDWYTSSWREVGLCLLPQCSAPCGGGIQRRQVKCINTQTGQVEEDSSLCDHEPWPESTQKCNPQDCEGTEAGFVCERDRLTFGFCQTLRVLGRCHLPTVHVQCCQSCRQHGHHAPGRDRGDERASRR